MSKSYHERVEIASLEINSSNIQDIIRYQFAANYVTDCVVVDIACGTGYGNKVLLDKGRAKTVIGMDISTEVIPEVINYKLDGTSEFCVSSVFHIPLASNSVDVVVSFETMEHVTDVRAYLRELKRVVKSDGNVIISTPLNNSEQRFNPDNPYHVREYNFDEFSQLLNHEFEHVDFWSQVTDMQKDERIEKLESTSIRKFILDIIRALVPKSIKSSIKSSLNVKPFQPGTSRIIHGIKEGSHVQLGICTKLRHQLP